MASVESAPLHLVGILAVLYYAPSSPQIFLSKEIEKKKKKNPRLFLWLTNKGSAALWCRDTEKAVISRLGHHHLGRHRRDDDPCAGH